MKFESLSASTSIGIIILRPVSSAYNHISLLSSITAVSGEIQGEE